MVRAECNSRPAFALAALTAARHNEHRALTFAKARAMTAVFVSSTSRDLPEYRDAVRRACDELALGVVGMEDFEAADLDAVRASLAQLDRADVYVGVFAWRFGL